jgi:hypothetical protein
MLPAQLFLAPPLLLGDLRLSQGLDTTPRLTSQGTRIVDTTNAPTKDAGRALVDYSTAAEYVDAHYGTPSYFGDMSLCDECIFDAREGVLVKEDDDNSIQPARLDKVGFELY